MTRRTRDRSTMAAALVLPLPGYGRFTAAAAPAAVEQMVVRHFPNGELHVDAPRQAVERACVIVGSISPPPGNIERLTLVAHALRRVGARRVTALLPYLAYARQDQSGPTESLGLAWAGELLRASGVDEVICVDVHSQAAPDVLGLPVLSLSPADVLAAALTPEWRADTSFVAPDEGAIPRCRAVSDAAGSDAPIVFVRKRRTPVGVEHLGVVGSPRRRAVVIDDILDTGATLVSCVRALRQAGVEHIGIVATHGLFTGDAWRALVPDAERLWITDTVLSRRRPTQAEVVPVAPLLAHALSASD